ncbi:MAG: hypothetical protein ACMXYG_03320 [Candidatus Woesearchaeota archaeon]
MGVAYIEPSPEKLDFIVERMIQPDEIDKIVSREEFETCINFIIMELDTSIRNQTKHLANVGQNHYFAIRSLNTPTSKKTKLGNIEGQLVGQEYFGVSRFSPVLMDIADIQYWAIWKDGDWQQHTWNHYGEHLAVGDAGVGKFQTGYLIVNGKLLQPQEVVSFVRGILRRINSGFNLRYNDRALSYAASQIIAGQTPTQSRLDQLLDVNWINDSSSISNPSDRQTYILRSKSLRQQATDKKRYDEWFQSLINKKARKNAELGPHGNSSDILDFFSQYNIEDKVDDYKSNPDYDKSRELIEMNRVCYNRFGISIIELYMISIPSLTQYTVLESQNNGHQQPHHTTNCKPVKKLFHYLRGGVNANSLH